MNFYKRFMGDYAKDTAHLSLVEHGAYTLMLDTLYSTEKGLPGPYVDLFRICRAMSKAEQLAVAKVADEFFPLGADGLRSNSRATIEIEEAAPLIEAARTNGKKGGRPKKQTQQKPSGFPEKTQKVTQSEPSSKASQSQSQISPSLRSGDSAKALGVPSQLLADYLVIRKAKKLGALTPTALAELTGEGVKAGLSLEDTMRACCRFGWGGFNAGWYAERQGKDGRKTTVPGPQGPDPELERLKAHKGSAPSLETLEKMAALRKPILGAH